MNDEFTVLDLSALRLALTSLQDGLEVVEDQAWFNQQPAKVQNTLIAGVIHCFELGYDLSFKMLRRQLELEAASPDEFDAGNFRDVLRAGAEKGLVGNVEDWFAYRRMRNITSHTYDHGKALQVYQGTLKFISDARALLAALEQRNG